MRTFRAVGSLWLLAGFLLSGCDAQSVQDLLPFIASATPAAVEQTAEPTEAATEAVTPTPEPTEGPIQLILWVPPLFDPPPERMQPCCCNSAWTSSTNATPT
jgi:hypothetical protein